MLTSLLDEIQSRAQKRSLTAVSRFLVTQPLTRSMGISGGNAFKTYVYRIENSELDRGTEIHQIFYSNNRLRIPYSDLYVQCEYNFIL